MKGTHISFGKYALQALEDAWVSTRQLEAGRRAIIANVRRGGKLWVRIFPDQPVTTKPLGSRMGKGVGSTAYCISVVQPGRILYEIDGVTEDIARKAVALASSKMPMRCRFILRDDCRS